MIRAFASLVALGLALGAAPLRADEADEVARAIQSGRAGDALRIADQRLARKPEDTQLRFLRGVALAELGRTTEAVAVFNKLIQDHPELPEPYNNLAVLYAGMGQFDRARASLEMAIRTNPSYSTAHENLGDLYATLASQSYNKAMQLDGAPNRVAPKLSLIRELMSSKGQQPPITTARAPEPAQPVRVAATPAAAVPLPAAPVIGTVPSAASTSGTPQALPPVANPGGPAVVRSMPSPAPQPAIVAAQIPTPAPAPAPAAVAAPVAAPAPAPSRTAALPSAPAPVRAPTPAPAPTPPSTSTSTAAQAPLLASLAPTALPSGSLSGPGVAASVAASASPSLSAAGGDRNSTARLLDKATEIEIQMAIEAWADAWSRKDLPAYYGAYAPNFKGDQASRSAWEETRAARITGKRSIQVSISEMKIDVKGNTATATFRQTYRGDALTAKSRKTLRLVEVGGRWRIAGESSS